MEAKAMKEINVEEAEVEVMDEVEAVVVGDVVEQVGEPTAVGLGLRGELADQQQRGDAVLVLHVLGVAAVAQRLLVAEGEALDAAEWPFPRDELAHAVRRGYEQLPRAQRRLPLV